MFLLNLTIHFGIGQCERDREGEITCSLLMHTLPGELLRHPPVPYLKGWQRLSFMSSWLMLPTHNAIVEQILGLLTADFPKLLFTTIKSVETLYIITQVTQSVLLRPWLVSEYCSSLTAAIFRSFLLIKVMSVSQITKLQCCWICLLRLEWWKTP